MMLVILAGSPETAVSAIFVSRLARFKVQLVADFVISTTAGPLAIIEDRRPAWLAG